MWLIRFFRWCDRRRLALSCLAWWLSQWRAGHWRRPAADREGQWGGAAWCSNSVCSTDVSYGRCFFGVFFKTTTIYGPTLNIHTRLILSSWSLATCSICKGGCRWRRTTAESSLVPTQFPSTKWPRPRSRGVSGSGKTVVMFCKRWSLWSREGSVFLRGVGHPDPLCEPQSIRDTIPEPFSKEAPWFHLSVLMWQ